MLPATNHVTEIIGFQEVVVGGKSLPFLFIVQPRRKVKDAECIHCSPEVTRLPRPTGASS